MRTLLAVLFIAFYAGAQSFAEPKDADHDGHDHSKHGDEKHDAHDDHEDHDHSEYENATLPQLLELMEKNVEELSSMASGQSTGDADEIIEMLIDAGKALPSKSGTLDEKQLLRVKSTVGSMQKIAMKLETALHQSNKAEAGKLAEQLGKLFALIESQYPESAHQGHEEDDHDH